MKFFQNIQAYDMHVKHQDGVTKQTIFGAVMTIFAIIIVILLIISEIHSYSSGSIVTRMITDNSIGRADESIRIHFDLDFMNIPCGKISFAQEVVRGQVHQHLENKAEDIKKEAKSFPESIDGPGCWVHGSMVTDKIAGNIVFKVAPEKAKAVAPIDDKRPTTAAEQMALLQRQMMEMQELPELPSISHRVNHVMMFPYGTESDIDSRDPLDSTKLRDDLLSFHSQQHGLLSNHTTTVGKGVGVHHYGIQVIPVQFHVKYGPIDGDVYQYSVTQRSLDTAMAAGGVLTLAGQSFADVFGVIFTYDFYPIKLVSEEKSEYFIDFLASLFGIIGGVITVIGLMERCLAESSKAVMGKKD
jgi:hypothetical protein